MTTATENQAFTTTESDVVILRIHGRFGSTDAVKHEALAREFNRVAELEKSVILDFSDCTELSARALQPLVNLINSLSHTGEFTVICGLNTDVLNCISIVRIPEMATLVKTQAEAQAHLAHG